MGTPGHPAPVSSPPPAGDLAALGDNTAPWPAAVRVAMAARAALLVEADGPLPAGGLDLGRREDRATVAATAAELRRPPHLRAALPVPLGTIPAVDSWGGFAAVPDLVGFLEAVRALLVPGGVLRFVEPAGRPGIRELVRSSFEARRPELHGAHLGRDLTASMRAAGLVVDSIHRTYLPGVPHLLGALAYGRAVLITEPDPEHPSGDHDPSEGTP